MSCIRSHAPLPKIWSLEGKQIYAAADSWSASGPINSRGTADHTFFNMRNHIVITAVVLLVVLGIALERTTNIRENATEFVDEHIIRRRLGYSCSLWHGGCGSKCTHQKDHVP